MVKRNGSVFELEFGKQELERVTAFSNAAGLLKDVHPEGYLEGIVKVTAQSGKILYAVYISPIESETKNIETTEGTVAVNLKKRNYYITLSDRVVSAYREIWDTLNENEIAVTYCNEGKSKNGRSFLDVGLYGTVIKDA